MVPIHLHPVLINKNDPVSVSIKCNADISPPFFNCLADHFRVGCPAVHINIDPVWLYTEGINLGSKLRKDMGCNFVSSTVSTVKHNFVPIQGKITGESFFEKNNISPSRIIHSECFSHFGSSGTEGIYLLGKHQAFNFLFLVVRKLISIPGKNLYTIILKRVMGGRYDNTRISPHIGG